jgi:hypothetical protein
MMRKRAHPREYCVIVAMNIALSLSNDLRKRHLARCLSEPRQLLQRLCTAGR